MNDAFSGEAGPITAVVLKNVKKQTNEQLKCGRGQLFKDF